MRLFLAAINVVNVKNFRLELTIGGIKQKLRNMQL